MATTYSDKELLIAAKRALKDEIAACPTLSADERKKFKYLRYELVLDGASHTLVTVAMRPDKTIMRVNTAI